MVVNIGYAYLIECKFVILVIDICDHGFEFVKSFFILQNSIKLHLT